MNDAANMRLFFGLSVPAEHQPTLQQARAHCELPSNARPVPTANYHLTLVFLGQIAAQRLPCIKRAAAGIATPAFRLQLDHLGHWPQPRALWAAPPETPAALSALVSSLQRRLQSCGIPPEQRPYRPHLTLARKVDQWQETAELATIAWRVEQFHLYQSLSSSAGVRYPILASWPLTARNPET